MLDLSPDVQGAYRAIPSSKRVIGLRYNVEYSALSAEARSGYGRAYKVVLLDEAGQIKGPTNEYVSMLETSLGTYDDSLMMIISTQAPSDQDYFSQQIDRAERSDDPHIVAHVYRPKNPECDLMDEEEWYRTNPGLGKFRSLKDMRASARKALELPAEESSFRNLLLNARISKDQLAFSPASWSRGNGEIDVGVFQRGGPVYMGLDLSTRTDLTAAVLAAEDADGVVHLMPFVFTPLGSLQARERRDRAPYSAWVRSGHIHGIAGDTMDYDQIADALAEELERYRIEVTQIEFDKFKVDHFKAACQRRSVFVGTQWVGVPQYFKDMGTRLASFQNLLMSDRIRHGSHPVMNMAASQAIAQAGREGVSALAKDKSYQRIDVLVAAVMAAWPLGDGRDDTEFDVAAWIG